MKEATFKPKINPLPLHLHPTTGRSTPHHKLESTTNAASKKSLVTPRTPLKTFQTTKHDQNKKFSFVDQTPSTAACQTPHTISTTPLKTKLRKDLKSLQEFADDEIRHEVIDLAQYKDYDSAVTMLHGLI